MAMEDGMPIDLPPLGRGKSRMFLQGLLTAMVEVSEITGKQPIDGMTDREWKMICDLNLRLVSLANAEVKRLDGMS